jgi:hypothetical protein
MADKPSSHLVLAVLRHVVALGLSTGLFVAGSFALPIWVTLWAILVIVVGNVQPTVPPVEPPFLLPCIFLIYGGLFNVAVSLPICLLVEWLVGDRGGLWWQLVFPSAMLCVFIVSAAVLLALLVIDKGAFGLEEFLGPWAFFGGMCASLVLAYWVTLAGLRFILERPMATGGASQSGAAA